MPIGVALGTAAATVGGAALGASAQKKAAGKAADASAASSAANTALARENYDNNAARLDPSVATGLRASGVLNDMLLGAPAPGTPTGGQSAGQYGTPQLAGDWNGYIQANPDVAAEWKNNAFDDGFANQNDFAQWHYQNYGRNEGRQIGPQPGAAQPNALSAFDQFRNSTNYQFRLGEGNKAFTQGAFAKGMGESGAAIKGAINYNQNFAANELGNFQDRLFQQQQVGMGAASALAGVGQNMVSNVTASNNAASTAAGNAALVSGQAQGQMYGSIAGALGTAAGSLSSSYGKPNTATTQYAGVLGGYYG